MSELVVFYSLSGKSRYVTERLAGVLKADLAEIVEVNPRYFAFSGFVRSALDSLLRRRPDPFLTMSETDFGNKIADGKIDAFARSIAVAPAKYPAN